MVCVERPRCCVQLCCPVFYMQLVSPLEDPSKEQGNREREIEGEVGREG